MCVLILLGHCPEPQNGTHNAACLYVSEILSVRWISSYTVSCKWRTNSAVLREQESSLECKRSSHHKWSAIQANYFKTFFKISECNIVWQRRIHLTKIQKLNPNVNNHTTILLRRGSHVAWEWEIILAMSTALSESTNYSPAYIIQR